jgi:sulfur carrier protein ThiS
MKHILVLISTAILLGSCSTMHIEKRKYRNGWYIEKQSNTVKPVIKTQNVDVSVLTETDKKQAELVCSEQEFQPSAPAGNTTQQSNVSPKEVAPVITANTTNKSVEKQPATQTQASYPALAADTKQPTDTIIVNDNAKPVKKQGFVHRISETKPHNRVLIGLGLLALFAVLTLLFLPLSILVAPLLAIVPFAFIISGIIDMIRKQRGTLTSTKSFKTFLTLFLAAIWTGFIATIVWIGYIVVGLLFMIFRAA